MVDKTLPQPQFYKFIETEGIEFAITVVLMRGFNYYDEWSGIKEWFLTAMTRATTKLVIVHNNEHVDESTGLTNFLERERDAGKLGYLVHQVERNGCKSVIVGSNYNYPIFRADIHLQPTQTVLPNIENKVDLVKQGRTFSSDR